MIYYFYKFITKFIEYYICLYIILLINNYYSFILVFFMKKSRFLNLISII